MTEYNDNLHNNSKGLAFEHARSLRERGGGDVNRLDKLFAQKKSRVLNMYCTAGYPQLNSTVEVITALQNNGADIIELGIPYSDPIADGPVIQQSNMQALQNGMSMPVLFQQLKDIRQHVQLPIVLMGYMNPVLQYGIEKFCADAASAGVDGIILPDLPMYEFETAYRGHFQKHDLKFIFLVTPQTSEERVRQIDALSSGFIYAVSSSSTTGNTKPIEEQAGYFKKLKDMNLANPVLVGFGIKDKQSFDAACAYSNGGIIGSAYINALKNTNDIGLSTKEFINTLKD
jgi:tryptophan synthase alpha chain